MMAHASSPTTTAPVPSGEEGARSLKLYELTEEYAQLNDLVADLVAADDEDPALAALGEALDALGGAIEQKAAGIGHVYLQQHAEADWLEHRAAVFAAEADRLRHRADVRRRGAERLKEYLRAQLASLGPGTQKVQLADVTVTVAKESEKPRVVVVDEGQVADAFKVALLRVPLTEVPPELASFVTDRKVAKTDLNTYVEETGVVPTGCELQPAPRSCRIY